MLEERLVVDLDKVARETIYQILEKKGFILYSGGIDSSILACLVSRTKTTDQWKLLTMGVENSTDLTYAESPNRTIPASNLSLIVRQIDETRVRKAIKATLDLVRVSTVAHFEDCVAFYLISEEASAMRDSPKLLLSANGPDELFCGYDRFRRIVDNEGYGACELEIERSLHVAESLRTQVGKVVANFSLRIREPFFDQEFVDFSLKIPVELKIAKGNDLQRKRIWRDYGRYLGLPEEVVARPKKAMQYSMGIHKIIMRLIKKGELHFKQTDQ